MESQTPKQKTDLSYTEWGLIIGAAAMVDLMQFVLDTTLIGPFVNWLIDISMGIALPAYLSMRGVKMTGKIIAGIAVTFFVELVPGVDALPLWVLDVIATMIWSKAEKKLSKTAIGNKVVNLGDHVAEVGSKRTPSNSLDKAA